MSTSLKNRVVVIVAGGVAEIYKDLMVNAVLLDLDNFEESDSLEKLQTILDLEDHWYLLPEGLREEFEKIRGTL